jgi:putative transposase
MTPKKEFYHNKLPHFQQLEQWYFVTCILSGAIPKGAMAKYSVTLEAAKNRYQLLLKTNAEKGNEDHLVPEMDKMLVSASDTDQKARILNAQKEYFIALKKYRLAYDKTLHNSNSSTIYLTSEKNRYIIENALQFWEGKRIENHAYCIMPNHIHWILTVKKMNKENKLIYLQDILHSVKLYTAIRINNVENKSGQLWEHESFDTTLRSMEHFYNAMNYTLQNPVSAGLVKNWKEWPGTWISKNWESEFPSEEF